MEKVKVFLEGEGLVWEHWCLSVVHGCAYIYACVYICGCILYKILFNYAKYIVVMRI